MNRRNGRLARAACLVAAVATGLIVTAGTAGAAESAGPLASADGYHHGHDVTNDTDTTVHSSGSGNTAVNVAGGSGYAVQNVDQSRRDDSNHRAYRDSSRRDSHNEVDSHNSTDYRNTTDRY
jgi:hypothetical protein